MVNLYLHGMLGRKFGKEYRGICVASAAEALHALDVNFKGKLRQYLSENKHRKYKIKIGERFVEDDEEVKGPAGRQDIHILPVIKGRNSGWGKIFAAVAIVALMWWNPVGWASAGGLFAGLSGTLTAAGVIAGGIAASLFMGGVSQILSPKVSYDNGGTSTSNPRSSSFSGNVDTVRQGYPMPVAYGRVLLRPLPISISLLHEDYTAGGIVSGPETDVTTNTNFNVGDGSPPLNPVGQTVNVNSNQSQYLSRFTNTVAPATLSPNTIPSRNTV